jgi:hypothetical protein
MDFKMKKVISRGGEVTFDSRDYWVRLNIRVTSDMIEQIQAILDDRPGIARTVWILEAIQEKIKHDQGNG